jgi:probable rRNA maturation factor
MLMSWIFHIGDPVHLLDRTQRLSPDEIELMRDALSRLLEKIDSPCLRCAVEVVDDARMCMLHERWKNDPSTTDVLTFPMSGSGDPIDADVAICLDEAERRAESLSHDRAHELVLYALHGVLHVTGHEDDTEEAFARMHAEEDRLLHEAGIGALFTPCADGKGTES